MPLHTGNRLVDTHQRAAKVAANAALCVIKRSRVVQTALGHGLLHRAAHLLGLIVCALLGRLAVHIGKLIGFFKTLLQRGQHHCLLLTSRAVKPILILFGLAVQLHHVLHLLLGRVFLTKQAAQEATNGPDTTHNHCRIH